VIAHFKAVGNDGIVSSMGGVFVSVVLCGLIQENNIFVRGSHKSTFTIEFKISFLRQRNLLDSLHIDNKVDT